MAKTCTLYDTKLQNLKSNYDRQGSFHIVSDLQTNFELKRLCLGKVRSYVTYKVILNKDDTNSTILSRNSTTIIFDKEISAKRYSILTFKCSEYKSNACYHQPYMGMD